MPSRKSDSRKSDARRSDVSAARFMLADDDTTMTTETPTPETPAPAPAPPALAAARASTDPAGSTPVPQQQPSDKKDKEKEKEKERDTIIIEDLTLPKSIITRLAKGMLPPNTQIQANAILALTKSATVFISHLANAANENTVASNKKTIVPADVFKALDETEFGFMREKLEAEFAIPQETQAKPAPTGRRSRPVHDEHRLHDCWGGGDGERSMSVSDAETVPEEEGEEEDEDEDEEGREEEEEDEEDEEGGGGDELEDREGGGGG
ncbi:hypothetical protein N0V88_004572 [Collariella sp. IMI 366227]|nr:hypothetical protein N0V88_004572 [Collariella sp. IMI 366227]